MNDRTILIVGTNMMALYNHRVELIKRLISLGYGVIVVAPRGGEEKSLEAMGVKFVDTPMDTRGTSVINDIRLLGRLIAIIKEEKPDVVLTFYTKTNIYGGYACRVTNTPYISNITGLGSAVSGGGFLQKMMTVLYKNAIRKASMVFFQNKSDKEFFKRNKIHVARHKLLPGSGVCLSRFKPLEYPNEEFIEFVLISRIIKEKGIEEYVETAKIIKKKYPNTIFHVVGPAEQDYEAYLVKAQSENVIEYHGKTYDVAQYLKHSHCFVFPSYYSEGMANVLLESAASARPVITTARPGCGETVEDGVTGYIVKERDVADLTAKIEKFINLPHEEKRQMGINGRKKMEREFDRDIVINAYVEEINKICPSPQSK